MRIQEQFVAACVQGDDEEARDLFFANWDEIDVNETDDVSVHFSWILQFPSHIIIKFQKQSSIVLRASMYGHFFVVQWLVEVAGAELDLQNEVTHIY